MNNKISIIVPVYNGEKYISRCLDSLIAQSYPNIEILIVNDGSIDNTLSICERYQKKDSKIVILNKNNGGLSSARNHGLLHFSGDYVIFVDADDFLDKDACAIINSDIENNKDIYIYIYNNYLINKTGIIECKNVDSFNTINQIILEAIEPSNNTNNGLLRSATSKVYSKNFIRTTKFDENIYLWEDLHYITSILKKINSIQNIKLISRSWYYYDKRNSSSITNKNDQNLYEVFLSEFNYIISLTNEMKEIDNKIINTLLCKFCWNIFWILYYKDQYLKSNINSIKWYENTKKYIDEKNINKIIFLDINAKRYFKFRFLLKNSIIRHILKYLIIIHNNTIIVSNDNFFNIT